MNVEIFKKLRTKLLLRDEYVDILKNMGYKNIYVVKVNSFPSYSIHPNGLREYVNNKVIHNRYELLVNSDITIFIDEYKTGIHFNGTCDNIKLEITDEDGLNIVSPFYVSRDYLDNTSKKGRRKVKN